MLARIDRITRAFTDDILKSVLFQRALESLSAQNFVQELLALLLRVQIDYTALFVGQRELDGVPVGSRFIILEVRLNRVSNRSKKVVRMLFFKNVNLPSLALFSFVIGLVVARLLRVLHGMHSRRWKR